MTIVLIAPTAKLHRVELLVPTRIAALRNAQLICGQALDVAVLDMLDQGLAYTLNSAREFGDIDGVSTDLMSGCSICDGVA
jgi:hypothetical protein